MRIIRKQRKNSLLHHTRVKKNLYHGQRSRLLQTYITDAVLACYYIIDNVAFSFGAQENMHKTFEAIKNWSWIAPTITSQLKQNIIISIRSQQFPKQRNKNNKQTKNA